MRRRRFLPLAAAFGILSLSLAGPAATAQQVPSAPSAVDKQIYLFFERFYAGDYKTALKIASSLETVDSQEGRAVKQSMRAAALVGLGKTNEARKLFSEADRAWPADPFVTMLQFDAALRTGQIDMAQSSFDTMIARYPDKVRELSDRTVWYLQRKLPKEEERRKDDRLVALARLGFGGSEGDYFTLDAVRILVRRGDFAGATELVQYIDQPQLIENMLIQKRYSMLWPKIEAMSGDSLAKVRASSVASAEQAYRESPDDPKKLQYLINARRHAGQISDAIALRSKLPATFDGLAKADEQMGWGINNVALALHDAGQADQADALYAQLNGAKIENDDWRVSMVINRVELLVADGKFAKAAELLPITESATATDGSPYAKQLVRRLKYCMLSGLGRKDEAVKLLPGMLAHAKDAYHATVDGLLCANELDQAEKLVLEALSDDDFQEQFVRSLQPTRLTSDGVSIWQDRWQEFRQRPAISKEFDRIGRNMPPAYLPPRPVA